jgi:hypothetical protein
MVLTLAGDCSMRLNPVFLVGPEPEKPPARDVSRRAFLTGIFGGAALGGGITLAVLRPWGTADPAPRTDSESLSWALSIQQADLEELLANYATFLLVFAEERDERLIPGLERLVVSVLERQETLRADAPALARSLATEIETNAAAAALRPYVDVLRRIR